MKELNVSFLLDKNLAVKLINHLCENHNLGDLGLGNGFFLIPPKRLDEGFKVLLDENRITLAKKKRIIEELNQMGFRTTIRGRGYNYYLTISLGTNPVYVDKRS
jgi:hypothetical protein